MRWSWSLIGVCGWLSAGAADSNGDGCEDAAFAQNRSCVHPTASVAGATIGAGAAVGPHVALGAGTVIGPRASLVGYIDGSTPQPVGAGATVGRRTHVGGDASIGSNTQIAADVSIGEDVTVGTAVVVGSGTQIGDSVTLGAGAIVGNLTSLGDFVDVGPGASLGREVTVASAQTALEGAVINGEVGAGSQIGAETLIAEGASVRTAASVDTAAQVDTAAVIGRASTVGHDAIVGVGANVRANAHVAPCAIVPAGEVVPRGTTWTAGNNCGGGGGNPDEDIVPIAPGVNLVFKRIPAGTFEMGCKLGRDTTSVAQCNGNTNGAGLHQVTLTHDYYCTESEITKHQFSRLTPGNHEPSWHGNVTPSEDVGPHAPVEFVLWHEAAWWANQISVIDGRTPCYSCTGEYIATTVPGNWNNSTLVCEPVGNPYTCDGMRLPTEAEWEYAARGNTNFIYSGSDVPEDIAWHTTNNTPNGPKVVKTKLPNGFGLYDLTGNVEEWTTDANPGTMAAYSTNAVTNPTGVGGTSRIVRGGHFGSGTISLRNARRQLGAAEAAYVYTGFRVCRAVQ
jgi:sulfatase modifying factor 1